MPKPNFISFCYMLFQRRAYGTYPDRFIKNIQTGDKNLRYPGILLNFIRINQINPFVPPTKILPSRVLMADL